ncbi:MAG: hypothetical protein H6546_06985 [Chitinophagales bacterium]|nr:hypothetical protein [Chitinophagales bacterium]
MDPFVSTLTSKPQNFIWKDVSRVITIANRSDLEDNFFYEQAGHDFAHYTIKIGNYFNDEAIEVNLGHETVFDPYVVDDMSDVYAQILDKCPSSTNAATVESRIANIDT